MQISMNHGDQRVPGIGRIVHYQSHGSADGVYESTCRAAVITELCHDSDHNLMCMSLAVLNPGGMFFNEHVPQNEINKFGGSWHWPERLETGEDHV